MGIVKKQAFWNSFINYIGIGIGYVNVVLLFPNIFDPQQFGLTRILIAITAPYVLFSSLGINNTIIRFFPLFYTDDNKHRGFLLLGLVIPLIGFVLVTAIYVLFEDVIMQQYKEQSHLFIENYYYAIPLSFLMLYCGVLESYLQALYKTVLSNFLRNVLTRILWALCIIVYYFGYISFNEFMFLFVYSYSVNILVMFFYIVANGQFHIQTDIKYYRARLLKLIGYYSLYTVLSGISQVLITRIDIIMIGFMIGLADTAVYAVAVYISSLIYVPVKEILRIAMPIVSFKWKKKKYAEVQELYKKVSINGLLIGGFIFVCLWANIDNFFQILPAEYANGKYVILYIAISTLLSISLGINSTIIVVSKYFRFDTLTSILLGIVAVLTNLLLIPLYGINGAAAATAISIFLYCAAMYIFLLVKKGMQPFTYKTLLAIIVLLMALYFTGLIPRFENYITDSVIRCAAISLIFFPLILVLKISDDINEIFFKVVKRLFV